MKNDYEPVTKWRSYTLGLGSGRAIIRSKCGGGGRGCGAGKSYLKRISVSRLQILGISRARVETFHVRNWKPRLAGF